eukprot:Skav218479  [mRNA]  locus=scaffold538:1157248:1162614:- [translate_table: standard]
MVWWSLAATSMPRPPLLHPSVPWNNMVSVMLLSLPFRGLAPLSSRLAWMLLDTALVTSLQRSLLTAVHVTNHHDLPTHALLRLSFDLPAVNPRVYKWLSPRPLDGLKINDSKVPHGLQVFHRSLASPDAPVADQFKAWAHSAERFLCSVGSIDGEDLTRPCWRGRCQSSSPVLVNLSPPRFKPGRPGDFTVPFPSIGIEVRKWQKLARQLQSLLRLLKRGPARAADSTYSHEVNLLWKAVKRAPVRPKPLDYAASIFGFRFYRLPSVEMVEAWSQKVATEASRKATAHWAHKKVAFTAALDHSCATQGGSFPFRLLREQPHPPVTAMTFTTWRDLPHFRPDLQRLLDNPGRYRSVVKLLLRQLDDHEWVHQGDFIFRDCCDRRFHLLNTPLSHVKWLLSFSWMVHVTGHFAHRLHCDSMDVLDPELSRVWTKYSSGDQGLLLTQLTGVTFTTDCLRSARGLQVDPRCPACGQLDSRVHRTRDCLRSAQARVRLARTIPLDELQPHHWAFGLWDRPDGTLEWQAALEQTPWFQSSPPTDTHMQFLFTDGSCLHPKEKRLRLAASSVIQGHSNATHTVRWSGPLPTACQSSFRAEVYALGVAVRLVCRAFICCDCEAAVKVARRLLALPPASRESALPSDHRDLWLYFIQGAAHLYPGAVHVRWVKAHRSWQSLTGRDRVLAWFNDVADREAKSALALRVTPAYSSLVGSWLKLKRWAVALADFHIAVAKDFVSVRAVEKSLPPAVDFDPQGAAETDLGPGMVPKLSYLGVVGIRHPVLHSPLANAIAMGSPTVTFPALAARTSAATNRAPEASVAPAPGHKHRWGFAHGKCHPE